MRSLTAALAEFTDVCVRERRLRASLSRDQGRSLGEIANQSHQIVSRAASILPARGPEAERVVQWLAGADGDVPRDFAVAVLVHRKQFPRVYLRAFVAEAVRRGGTTAGRMIALASEWLGGEQALDAMTELAEHGTLSYTDGKFLLYYVCSTRGEGVEAARRALVEALRNADDAPPGARDA